jgi:hypothetical protein
MLYLFISNSSENWAAATHMYERTASLFYSQYEEQCRATALSMSKTMYVNIANMLSWVSNVINNVSLRRRKRGVKT